MMAQSSGQFQHYISQFLLRNFEDKTRLPNHQIWRYSLAIGKCKLQTIKKQAGRANAWDKDFEDFFSKLETKAAAIIQKLLKTKREGETIQIAGVTLDSEEWGTVFDYCVWLTDLQPKRTDFILKKSNCETEWNKFLNSPGPLSSDQTKQVNDYREQYRQTGKVPDLILLRRQHMPRFKKLIDFFDKPYFLVSSAGNPFIIPDYYIIPIIAHNYEKGNDPWKWAGQIYFPIAPDMCLVWNRKNLSDANIKQFSNTLDIEDINRTAVIFAEQASAGKCIYGATKESLERAIYLAKQRGYVAWNKNIFL